MLDQPYFSKKKGVVGLNLPQSSDLHRPEIQIEAKDPTSLFKNNLIGSAG